MSTGAPGTAGSQDASLWAHVRTERAALAEDLAGLAPEQWRRSTLCGEWDVEEVVAHLVAAASLGRWPWVRSIVGARFRPEVHNQRRMTDHRGTTSVETLERFRAIVGSTTAPSGHTSAYLGEVLVHAQDIRRPLGIRRSPSVEALTPVADFYAHTNFTVPSRTTAEGVQLRADDGPFATGTGPLVTGSTLALVMSMAGRAPYLDLAAACTQLVHLSVQVLIPGRHARISDRSHAGNVRRTYLTAHRSRTRATRHDALTRTSKSGTVSWTVVRRQWSWCHQRHDTERVVVRGSHGWGPLGVCPAHRGIEPRTPPRADARSGLPTTTRVRRLPKGRCRI
ncbi:uncharacterized protein (TIGR03083 family) [Sanguibacter antarcticus]|uniref:Uncharacterized protein (TIGR03083 family) n=1 Tax=Sanguibacter antarcticus TaxID=372484 RepID=A0A2A9E9J0_9MICO|nr:uncharacterized protein (TIGR03083 family) [Sanguibacter antarcticus]